MSLSFELTDHLEFDRIPRYTKICHIGKA